MARQSAADRAKRLNSGCCPIHGIGMPQVGQHYYIVDEGPPLGVPMTEIETLEATRMRYAYTIVECPREDCGVQARMQGPNGPAELLHEWEYLLQGE